MIDAHHHFWHPARGDYGWMPEDDPVLSRPYAPHDLAPFLKAANMAQTVLVQAAPSVAETEYLLGIADATDHVAGVVGWIDFEDKRQIDTLKRFAAHPKFKGVRPMIQDIADNDWMLRADIAWAFEAIEDLGLTFDALGYARHIGNFNQLFRRYPGIACVIDHAMKPQIGDDDNFAAWADGMAQLAQTQALVKLSGLVTEADEAWNTDALQPYVDHLISQFGPARMMWGSDWPVVRLRCEYDVWHDAAHALTAKLGSAARRQIFHDTAARFYRLEETV